MSGLTEFCAVCLSRNEEYHRTVSTQNTDAELLHKLQTCAFVTDFLDINTSLQICNKCFDTLQIAYNFIEMCRKNSIALRGYVAQLNHITALTQLETARIAQRYIKQEIIDECTTEQNVNQSENLESQQTHMYNKPITDLKVRNDAILTGGTTAKEEIIVEPQFEFFNIKQEPLEITDNNKLEDFNNINKQQIKLPTKDVLIHTGASQLPSTVSSENVTQLKCKETQRSTSILEDDRKFICYVCEKRFKHGNTLRTHFLVHTGENKFPCTICGKVFSEPSNLRRHTRIHTGEKKHQCTLCDQRFADSSNLKTHMLVHSGEKNYPCTICDRKFSRVSSVNQHMLIHTGEKKFQCSVCEKRFRNSSNLKVHMQVHYFALKY